MVGIYKITSPSGKVYIGQSWNIKDRLNHYKCHNRKNGQIKLENSFAKHGVENHIFGIAHELPEDVEQKILDRYEQLYMDMYRDVGVELLNLREGGMGAKHTPESKKKIGEKAKGRIFSEETRNKIGKASKGRIRSKQWRERQRLSHLGKTRTLSKEHIENIKKAICKSVIQYSLEGKFIKEWSSATEAFKKLKCTHIGCCCKGKRKKAGGFIWKFKNKE